MKAGHVTCISGAGWPVHGDDCIYRLFSGNRRLTQLTQAGSCLCFSETALGSDSCGPEVRTRCHLPKAAGFLRRLGRNPYKRRALGLSLPHQSRGRAGLRQAWPAHGVNTATPAISPMADICQSTIAPPPPGGAQISQDPFQYRASGHPYPSIRFGMRDKKHLSLGHSMAMAEPRSICGGDLGEPLMRYSED